MFNVFMNRNHKFENFLLFSNKVSKERFPMQLSQFEETQNFYYK